MNIWRTIRPAACLLLLSGAVAQAAPITFDLRAPSIEAIDEVNSFSLSLGGVTATLTAQPLVFDGHPLLLNQTASAFGVNVFDTTCGGAEDSDELDNGCVGESIQIVFDTNVFLNSLRVSSFGASDQGLATIGASLFAINSTGDHALGNTFLAAGDPWTIAYIAGNGFSFDRFTVTAPEPASLLLFALGGGLVVSRRHRRKQAR